MKRNPIPETWDALEAAGYKFLARRNCHECNRTIEFWETPSGRKAPLEKARETGTYFSHFAVCPKADQFRRTPPTQPQKPVTEKPRSERKKQERTPQRELFKT